MKKSFNSLGALIAIEVAFGLGAILGSFLFGGDARAIVIIGSVFTIAVTFLLIRELKRHYSKMGKAKAFQERAKERKIYWELLKSFLIGFFVLVVGVGLLLGRVDLIGKAFSTAPGADDIFFLFFTLSIIIGFPLNKLLSLIYQKRTK